MKRFYKKVMPWLARLAQPDHIEPRVRVIAADLRKVGVYAMSAGLIGLMAANDTIQPHEGGTILWVGVLLWIVGVVLTKKKADYRVES